MSSAVMYAANDTVTDNRTYTPRVAQQIERPTGGSTVSVGLIGSYLQRANINTLRTYN